MKEKAPPRPQTRPASPEPPLPAPADPPALPLEQRIAAQVRQLRSAAGLSLEGLAARSGVSRSMISLIERGESSATAVVLDRLAAGLGVTLATLFEHPDGQPLRRRAEQPVWRDPASGYQRRNVSPAGVGSVLQVVEVLFPPGARVAYDRHPGEPPVRHQVWLLEGRLEVAVGTAQWQLETGDCLAFTLDRPTAYHNPGDQPARYAVLMALPHRL